MPGPEQRDADETALPARRPSKLASVRLGVFSNPPMIMKNAACRILPGFCFDQFSSFRF
jgi:hypothetical protein